MPPETTPVTGPFAPVAPGPPRPAQQTDIFSSDGFLKLLAGQIRAQNPLDPMKDTEFVAQMAQFSQLERMTSIARNIEALTLSGRLSQGASLIGRTVTYRPADGTAPVTGVVSSLAVGGDGRSMSLVVDGAEVDMRQIVRVDA